MTNDELMQLKALAEAVGGEVWYTDESGTGTGRLHNTYVWGGDGDCVAQCFGNIGHMPEPVEAHDVAVYVAAANPSAILALIAKVESLAADADRYRNLRDADDLSGPGVEASSWPGGHSIRGEELDSAIDAAMAKEKA